MKLKNCVLLFVSVLLIKNSYSQGKSWEVTPSENRVFIENKGQFNIVTSEGFINEVRYSFDSENEDFYFTPAGVVLDYLSYEKRDKSNDEKEARRQQKIKGFDGKLDFQKFEQDGRKMKITYDRIEAQWIGADPGVEIIAEEKTDFYHNYSYYNNEKKVAFTGEAKSYKKITYKNLYPNIDVIYEIHPESGLKYSVIIHPGGNIADVKLHYSKNIKLMPDGSIRTATKHGDVIDHAPVTFYRNNAKRIIKSSYKINNNTISFEVENYDASKSIVIDPWTQSPTFATNWDCVWECEKDNAGNVYIIGGIMPMQIIKYNSGGTTQWTYNTPYDTSNCWLGTFAVDNNGNSYVTAGSAAQIQKVNTAGTLVWDNPNPGGLLALTEFWNITFNCDQTRLAIGGTDGFAFGGPKPYIFDVDMSNGNVITALQVHESVLFNDQEVRSITPCNNSKYYFLTHDTIGYVHHNLVGCGSSGATLMHTDNGINLGYKCENFRVDNSGIMALAHYNGFVYVHRGNQLQKRDFATAAIVGTVAIPSGAFTTSGFGNSVGCSGIDIDDCGNVYVGSTNGVYKFDQNLVPITTLTFSTSFNVYDVEVSTSGDIIAAGSTGNSGSASRTGSIKSFAAVACNPQVTVCCDPTICTPDPVCATDPTFTISTITAGGTWTASCGTCINATTGVFDPAVSGQGTFTITYTISCGSESSTVTVYNCTPLDVCIESNGDLTVSGGNGPYEWEEYLPASTTPITNQAECLSCDPNYSWNIITSCMDGLFPVTDCNITAGYYPFATGTTITPGTNYPIQVSDASGQTVTINSSGSLPPCTGCPTLTVTTSSVTATCNGQSTGSFSASTAAGVGPYDYTLLLGASTIATFSNVAGSQSFTGLAAGTYTLNVLDNNGCPGTVTVTINSNPAITITQTSITPASCGSNNGSVTVSASGGSGSFTYSWNSNPVQTGATASNLAAGPYIVTATDALGCTQTFNVTITSAGGPTVTITNPVNPTCNNGTNGTATASVSGGTGTMDYAWSPAGGTAATGTGLSGGILYTVTVTDDNGCVGTATITLTNPTAITVTTSATDANCGASDGTLTASASGGTGTLDYSWSTSPVQNTATATAVPAGTYTVTVTDDNGCTATAIQSVNNVGAPTISIVSQTDVTCNGGNDGAAVVSGSGGTGGLTYSWNTNPVQTGTTASALTAGTYTATVTDGAGCSASVTVTIIEPTAITGTTTNTPANCAASDGTASVTASGGDGNYTYLWSNNATTASISGLAPGTYTVTITDGNGCTGTATAIVGTVSTANINAGPDVVITTGSTTTLVASGGVTYSWTPSTGLSCTNCSSPDANPDTTTMYIVTATDANGCVGSDTVIVYVEEPCGNLWVPTAFSPNADYNNDKLCVYGGCILSMTFQIFDRWGEVVFETTTNELCWDGYYKDKQMNSGVFAYYLIATLSNGDVVEKSGNITLVR